MWRSVICNKSTEINAPPQVFLSFNEANGAELWYISRIFISGSIISFVLFHSSFLKYKEQVWKTPDTKVVPYISNPRIKTPSVYKPAKKCLWLCISFGLILGVPR